MEIHQLKILRELGALGSVAAVATALDVTPSAVSQHLAALQRGFRTPLTRKNGRLLVLTEAGVALATAGSVVIEGMETAKSAVEDFEQTPTGPVFVSGFATAAQALFNPLVTELTAHPPSPEVHFCDEDVAQDMFPALTSRYDVVMAHRLKHSPPWPPAGLHVVKLLDEPLDVALPVGHPLAQRTALTPADVAIERWVASRPGYSPDDVLRAIAAVAERSPNVMHRVNDYGAVAGLVASGDVVGLLPRYTYNLALRPQIVLRPLTGLSARRSIDILTRPENLHRRSVRMVIAGLQRCASDLIRSVEGTYSDAAPREEQCSEPVDGPRPGEARRRTFPRMI